MKFSFVRFLNICFASVLGSLIMLYFGVEDNISYLFWGVICGLVMPCPTYYTND